jgi:hypothetical protein
LVFDFVKYLIRILSNLAFFTRLALQVTLSKENKIPHNMPLEIGDEILRM